MIAHYRLCGLRIETDLAPPFWQQADEDAPANVRIVQGAVPPLSEPVTVTRALYTSNGRALRYELPGVVRFTAHEGREIVFELPAGSSAASARPFLLTAALAAALHQRRAFVLTGAAVEIEGSAALLTGASGVGKSTLAAALHATGYRVLSDEFTVIQLDDDGAPLVLPAAPVLSLWRGALYNLGKTDEDIDRLPRVRPGIEKYYLPTDAAFSPAPVPLRAIYLLATPVEALSPIVRLSALQALTNLNWCIYYQRFAIDMGAMRDLWRPATQVVERVRAARLLRVFPPFEFEPWMDALLKDYRA
jgi:hypothetical protein